MFEDLAYSQPRNLYVKKPVQDFVNAGMMLNRTYDTNLAAANKFDMALADLPAREEIKGQLNEEVSKYNKALKDMASTGRYEDYSGQINKLAMDFVKNPMIKGIQEDYKNYSDYITTQQERLNKDEINRDDFEKSLRLLKTAYNKPLEFDPLTGTVKNKFQGTTIPQDVDVNEEVRKLVKDLEEDIVPADMEAKIPGYYSIITKEGKNPEKLAQLARQYVLSNDKVKTLLNFRADLDTKLARLNPDGSLRPYTQADLYNLGITKSDGKVWIETEQDGKPVSKPINEINNVLFDENGNLNQNVADSLVKSKYLDSKVQEYENYAKSFANEKYKFDFKENWLQRQQRQFQHDFDIENIKADNERRKEGANGSIYTSIFTALPGDKTTLDTKVAQSLLDNQEGNPVNQADFNSFFSPETNKMLNSKDYSTAEIALLKDLKDIKENLDNYTKRVKGSSAKATDYETGQEISIDPSQPEYTKNIGYEKTKARDLIKKLQKINPTKYGSYNISDGHNIRTSLNKLYNQSFKDFTKPQLQEIDEATFVYNDLTKLGKKKFKVTNYSGNENFERTKEGGRFLLDAEMELEKSDYDALDKKTRNFLNDKKLLRTETTIKDGKEVKTYYIKSKYNVNPSAGGHALFDKSVGINGKEGNYLNEQQRITNYIQSSRNQSIKQAEEIAPLVAATGKSYDDIKIAGYGINGREGNLTDALLYIQQNAHLWSEEETNENYNRIKKAITNGN